MNKKTTEENIYLAPCPFCGRTPVFIFRDIERNCGWDIACKTFDCYLESGADWHHHKDEIVLMWNTRVKQK